MTKTEDELNLLLCGMSKLLAKPEVRTLLIGMLEKNQTKQTAANRLKFTVPVKILSRHLASKNTQRCWSAKGILSR